MNLIFEMSDSEEDDNELKNTKVWKEKKRIEYMYLKACKIGDIDYIKENFQESYKNKGLTIACQNKNPLIIKFLIKKGAFKCDNCVLNKEYLNGRLIFINEYKKKTQEENPKIRFGDLAKLLKEKWEEIENNNDKTEWEKYETRANTSNKKNLKCLKKITKFSDIITDKSQLNQQI